jgi:hypothetical protein
MKNTIVDDDIDLSFKEIVGFRSLRAETLAT